MARNTIVTRIPVEVWTNLQATVSALDRRVTAIEKAQKTQRNMLAFAIAVIPPLTAAIVTIIEAIRS